MGHFARATTTGSDDGAVVRGRAPARPLRPMALRRGAIGSVVATFFAAALAALALAPAASAADPVAFTDSAVVDSVGALAGDTSGVDAAIDDLYSATGVQLYVAFVDEFTNPADRAAWADATAAANGFGTNDVLLAVATTSRQYQISVDEQFALLDEQLASLQSDDVEPALADSRWDDAAVAAAQGIQTRLNGGGASGSGGSADLLGTLTTGLLITAVVFVVIIAVIVVIVILVRRRSRSRRASADRPDSVPIDELKRRAGGALVETDDAVRTSEQELGFAIASFGEGATAEFSAALASAKSGLTEAFTLQQKLDDTIADSPQQQREWYLRILQLCEEANTGLDEKAVAFDELRALEKNAPAALAAVEASLSAQRDRLPTVAQQISTLAAQYPSSASAAVADNVEQATDRLDFAATSVGDAHEDVGSGRAGEAAVVIRGAEESVQQAGALLDAVATLAVSLSSADAQIASLAAAVRADVATASVLLERRTEASDAAAADVSSAIARTTTILDEVDGARSAGGHDPLALLARVQEADHTIDAAVDGFRDAQAQSQRQLAALDSALLSARSHVSAAEDFITSRRGAVGAEARTRLAEAGRCLSLATSTAPSDPASALASAERAAQLAADALRLAQSDTASFGSSDGGIDELFGARSPRGNGGGLGGAILGGIVIDQLFGGGGSRGGGFGGGGFGSGGGFGGGSRGGSRGGGSSRRSTGSFGGSSTRGRRGGGGHF